MMCQSGYKAVHQHYTASGNSHVIRSMIGSMNLDNSCNHGNVVEIMTRCTP